MEVRKFVQRLVRKFIPAPIRDKAKAVIIGLGTALQAVNLTLPAYGDEATTVVGVIIAIATFLGVYEVPNVPVDQVGERPRGGRRERQRV
jgi:hypothetical protein